MNELSNKYYFQSLKNDENLNFRISSVLKEELSKLAKKRKQTVTELITTQLIDLVCEENKKNNY